MLKIKVIVPYLVVKQGKDKNQVRNLCGETGTIIDFKLNGTVLAKFANCEIYEIPRDAFRICIK